MKSVLDRIHENEVLYEDIDVRIDIDYSRKYQKTPKQTKTKQTTIPKGRIITQYENSIWYVGQQGKYRIEKKSDRKFEDGDSDERIEYKMFDGENSKLLSQKLIVNLIKGFSGDKKQVRPHTLFFINTIKFGADLSTYLSGHEAIAAASIGDWDERKKLQVEYKGTADFKGLKCHEVWVTTFIGDRPFLRWEIWLAAQKNFIPVRVFNYTFSFSRDLPVGEAEVLNWIEIKPGIWFPKEAVFTAYDKFQIKREKKKTVRWTERFTTEHVSLDPHYDLSFFQNLEIPDGALIYEIEDDEIVKSYRHNALSDPKVAAAPVTRWWENPFVIVNVIFVLMVIIYLAWKRLQKINAPAEQKI
ncbi:hypothetical protein [Gimesia aquarii]|nr:hypothetical protein [Gimesia aquarii]